jgi:hypothetical protein
MDMNKPSARGLWHVFVANELMISNPNMPRCFLLLLSFMLFDRRFRDNNENWDAIIHGTGSYNAY